MSRGEQEPLTPWCTAIHAPSCTNNTIPLLREEGGEGRYGTYMYVCGLRGDLSWDFALSAPYRYPVLGLHLLGHHLLLVDLLASHPEIAATPENVILYSSVKAPVLRGGLAGSLPLLCLRLRPLSASAATSSSTRAALGSSWRPQFLPSSFSLSARAEDGFSKLNWRRRANNSEYRGGLGLQKVRIGNCEDHQYAKTLICGKLCFRRRQAVIGQGYGSGNPLYVCAERDQ